MDYKVGDIVVCIKEPNSDEYRCPVGFIGKITETGLIIRLNPVPLQIPMYQRPHHNPCFRRELFVLAKDLTKLEKAFYSID